MHRVLHRKALGRQLCRRPFATSLHREISIQIRGRPRAPGPVTRYAVLQKRKLGGIPTVLLPPVVFGGLFIALWTWKCLMMVLFQNKIIYMPGLPPNARRETIEQYKNQCHGIEWREEKIRSLDGTRISLCVASVNSLDICQGRMVYILYFQGNASSIPPRLPFLSPVLRVLRDRNVDGGLVRYTMVCCSYRGYWTSKGRPSEKGIAMDAAASLQWIRHDFIEQGGNHTDSIPLLIWGQSIGAGVATNLTAQSHLFSNSETKPQLSLEALILETPFISVKAMLETLYPQKWLPYRHLWPFLWNQLDTFQALGVMRQQFMSIGLESPKIVLLVAGKDELVPREHGEVLEQRGMEIGLDVQKRVIGGALHTEVMVRPEGRLAVIEAVEDAARRHFDKSRVSIQ